MEIITSRTNPLCTHLRKLASSVSYRRDCGEFLCDSPKLLEEALLWRADLRTVVCTDPTALPALPDAVRRVQVPGDLMKSISPAQTPQGVLSVCGLPGRTLPEQLTGRRYVVLDGVQDPGNVGTILRTADAFHADGLFLVNACADLYNPKTVRASMGAVFRCPVWTVGAEELSALRAGRAAGAADEERPALVWRGPSERYGGRAAGGLLSLRRGRWQRGEGPLGGRAGGL